MQDKTKEKEFFDRFSAAGEYDVLTTHGYRTIINNYIKIIKREEKPKIAGSKMKEKELLVLDLGCGTGTFTREFKKIFCPVSRFFGIDISTRSVALGAQLAPNIFFCAADIEHCCFKDNCFDIVLFSGVLHHFVDFAQCLQEAFRILAPGGCALSYDPHVNNPCMWLFRHPSSPFFSKTGKTENERLLSAGELEMGMKEAGFRSVKARGIGGVTFKYLESRVGRMFLPFYNLFEILLGVSPLAKRYGSFLVGYGVKP